MKEIKKLSQMDTNEMLDVLLAITPELEGILADDEIMGAFGTLRTNDEKGGDTGSATARGLTFLVKIATVAFKNHRNAVYGILSAFTGMTAKEVGAQNGAVTINQLKTILSDGELLNFFKSAKQ